LGGATLQLQLVETTVGDVFVRDAASGRRWSGLTGRALDPAVPPLQRITATQFVVQNFRAHFPNGDIYTTRQ
jgi:hypothetical protein